MRVLTDRRLHFHSLARPRFERAVDVVEWLGAVQSQDYAGAKWAVAQRTTGVTDQDVDEAFNRGAILRTHVLRPTWHFVLPRDIRWMLALTAPRINLPMAFQGRSLGLDSRVFARSQRLLARELAGGRFLTRQELAKVLGYTGLPLGVILMRAELDAVICSGPLEGKQHTFALLDERVADHRTVDREQALALLARRFFRSHGPATLRDFRWWSGLSAGDAKTAAATAGDAIASETIDGQTYWLSSSPATPPRAGGVHLLPNFDEYLVAYTDRSAAYDGTDSATTLRNTVVIDGRIVGTWRRTFARGAVAIQVSPLKRLRQTDRLARAVERYGAFLGRAASFQV